MTRKPEKKTERIITWSLETDDEETHDLVVDEGEIHPESTVIFEHGETKIFVFFRPEGGIVVWPDNDSTLLLEYEPEGSGLTVITKPLPEEIPD